MLCTVQLSSAALLSGRVTDQETGEPLLGALVLVDGTMQGTATDYAGNFQLNIEGDDAPLIISYISYVTQAVAANRDMTNLDVKLVPDSKMLASVTVVGKANMETEVNLQSERIASNVAIENLGVREMKLKGLSDVEEGVKKMTGISVANQGQVIVRGLGDRYSITTFNGLPIASPNPDNKLIPLDIFPSMAVKNITVSKVYNAASYADYAGAHIDITSRDFSGKDFFSVDFGVNADFSALCKDYYQMDNVSLFSMSKYNEGVKTASDTNAFLSSDDMFDTTFNTNESTGLPTLKGSVGYGHTYDVGSQKLNILLNAGIDNKNASIEGASYQEVSAQGSQLKYKDYDSYKSSLDIAALASVGMSLRESDNISYTLFYARNASSEFLYNYNGFDQDKDYLDYQSVNSITKIYSMMTNQLRGVHQLGEEFKFNWAGAYTSSTSDLPDTRQVMLEQQDNGDLTFINTTTGFVNRTFRDLDENEFAGDISLDYNLGDNQVITAGGAYKSKSRDFVATLFNYNVTGYQDSYSATGEPVVSNIYDLNGYLSQQALQNGDYTIVMKSGDLSDAASRYAAACDVYSAFVASTFNVGEDLVVDLGLRFESGEQSVTYTSKWGDDEQETTTLSSNDIFPALNAKYKLSDKEQLRFAASRTITRPSFQEMSPYEYTETFSTPKVYGNENIQNGYNVNFDLRYETFYEDGDMFSATIYGKLLDSPIERMQVSDGYTYNNAQSGAAAGVELEYRKKLWDDVRLGLNGSYMYTTVTITETGLNYTNSKRALQGASPYLFNVDISYAPKVNDKQLTLAMMYNYQGERIDAVGMMGCGDIIQKAVNTLNFTASYELSKRVSLGMKLKNLLAMPYVYEQYMEASNQTYVIEEYNPGVAGDITIGVKF